MSTAADDKARAVRDMFGAIAHRYDFLNHFLSANIDRRWRRKCVEAVRRRISGQQPPRILDVGCGTGDLSIEFSRLGPVAGCDFCHPMLRIGARKVSGSASPHAIALLSGDALALPFHDAAFDVVVSAFVLRNLADLDRGLAEMRRVLKPGGTLAALEFAIPKVPLLGGMYQFYFAKILPSLGRFISGNSGAYRYLPESVQAFPPPETLERVIARAGFRSTQYWRLSAGITVLYLASSTDSR
jgi:demethylmenaquinone methyltransferase / 2-methoxy-6-polyprenyl-1,4-benzoquinol methylase